MKDARNPENNRASPRRRAFIPGEIILAPPPETQRRIVLDFNAIAPPKPKPIYCTVIDLSATGARLSFGQIPNLPGEFELAIASQGTVYRVEIRWQSGRQIGVAFLSSRRLAEFGTRQLPVGIM